MGPREGCGFPGTKRPFPRADDRQFEDYDLVLAAAEGSLGLALLRQPLAQGWLDSGRLVPISSQVQPNPQCHYLAHRQGEQRESVLVMADALCRIAAAPASLPQRVTEA